jgi:hypothetical protein
MAYDYVATVRKAVFLLNIKSEKNKGFQFERCGYLDESKEVSYEFHGIGCLIKSKDFKVDFDFGVGGRCDGLDAWFLFAFLRDNEAIKLSYPLLKSGNQIKDLLHDLENHGIVTRNLGYHNEELYYLITDIHKPDIPIWKPNWPDNEGS